MASQYEQGSALSESKTIWAIPAGIQVTETMKELMVVGLDEAFERLADLPKQGAQFFKSIFDKKGYRKYQAVVGTGLMKQTRDTEDASQITKQQGFGYEYSSVIYKVANAITREMLQKDLYNQVGDQQRQLADAGDRSLEMIYADVFNRGFGGLSYSATQSRGTGLSQFTCEDGCYLIDSNRPNPIGTAGTWGNRLPDIAFTAGGNNDAVFGQAVRDAKLNFKKYLTENGDMSPMMLKRVIISPELEDTAMRVFGTKAVYSGDTTSAANRFSDQAENTVSGTPYTVYDWLDAGNVFFEAKGNNELECLWAYKPETMIYSRGNPDVFWQRLRCELGTGCKRPATWQGLVATGTDNL